MQTPWIYCSWFSMEGTPIKTSICIVSPESTANKKSPLANQETFDNSIQEIFLIKQP